MKTCKFNYVLLFFLYSVTTFAQTEKFQKNYTTNADVLVKVDARHTNILIEPWDKNEVQIEAFLNSDNAGEEALKNWKLETTGNTRDVKINSAGSSSFAPMIPPLPALEEPLAELPGIMEPLMEMVGPLLENISKNPLPPNFQESMGSLHFDYEAYKKEGEKYILRWEKEVEKNFGKDFEKSMEEWTANFKEDSLVWKNDMELKMEAWGEEFGKSMEKWGENFEKGMEQWAEQIESQIEEKNGQGQIPARLSGSSAKAERTIKIKIPKNATLELTIKHGEIELEGETINLNAVFSHSQFSAHRISGDKTNVKASYTPVNVKQWEYGILNTAYVRKCELESVKSLKLISNSSDVKIGEIKGTAIIEGSFGKLDIITLGTSFKTVDISLENSDLDLNLPESALNFNYNGTKSTIEYPASIKSKPLKSYDSEIINGYYKSKGGNGVLNINTKFSQVTIK